MNFFKILLFAFLVVPVGFSAVDAQLLNSPESVVYDSLRDRYLVSNWDTGHMVQIDSNGVQDYFVVSQHCYAGLHIVDDVVYVAGRNQGVRGFDLETGQLVMHVSIPGSGVLNDITSDNMRNLYISDVNVHRIYKINIITENWSTFVSSGLSSPNGIYFDEPHNRLLLVSSRNLSPLQAISLDDSSLTTIVYTGVSILDGLTMDEQGNVYFSSWNTNAVYKYDSTFTNPPELISNHAPDPADISYDPVHDILAVPIFYGNYIDFVEISQTSTEFAGTPLQFRFDVTNYPNPFNAFTTIEYYLDVPSFVGLDIYDMLGRKIASFNKGFQKAGTYKQIWDGDGASSGIYYLRIKTDSHSLTRSMVLLK
jgi:sugar lactone lactonase YvrE